jgi:glycosyltransferase involved in cell wall biosynthesis
MRADPVTFQIIQVNLQADRGGDGRIVSTLHRKYRERGYPARLFVGRGSVTQNGEAHIPNDDYRPPWAQAVGGLASARPGDRSHPSMLRKSLPWIAEPRQRWRIHEGFEDFEFPATLPFLSDALRDRPAILHLHNLHGGYFDLRALPALNRLAPVFLTLHDEWTYTGHCAHSTSCDRWTQGCGSCPDLTTYPAIPKDRTAQNFDLKRRIFAQTRIHLTTPSHWLMERAQRSLLSPAIEEARVIPNGIDTDVFHSGDAEEDRLQLDLPLGAKILLCAGSIARSSQWMSRSFVRSAVEQLGRLDGDAAVVFVGSGETAVSYENGARVYHRPFERDVLRMASYYRAADVYLHAALADNFPTAVLESLACGTPVIATDVGGIPEQVNSLWRSPRAAAFTEDSATGVLLAPTDQAGLCRAIDALLGDDHLRARLAVNAANSAKSFSVALQVDATLAWYHEILNRADATRLRSRSSA